MYIDIVNKYGEYTYIYILTISIGMLFIAIILEKAYKHIRFKYNMKKIIKKRKKEIEKQNGTIH